MPDFADSARPGGGPVTTCDYRFALVIFRENGDRVGSASLNVDWEPAVQSAGFQLRRRGELPLNDGCGAASIVPRWDRELGQPYCRGFRVVFDRGCRSPCVSDYPTSYFRQLASKAASLFVEKGKLEDAEVFQYVAVAFAEEKSEHELHTGGLRIEEQVRPLRVIESSLAVWQQKSVQVGVVDDDDAPVFVPPCILDEVAAQTLAERGRETGGILIGHLHRDSDLPELFLEISAQVPAEHTRGDAVKLTFTHETWAAVDAAIKLRGHSESYLGWWHSHPVWKWCASRQCDLEKQKSCGLQNIYSQDDQDLHRVCFPFGHSIALVANDTAFQDVTFSWYGWRAGSLQPRGYHRLIKGDEHAA